MSSNLEENKALVRRFFAAIESGDFAGLTATGREINTMAFQRFRIENGQLAEHWEVADFALLMRQLES